MIALRSSHPRAFTLIELMLSIALVVVLLFGVEQLFQTTTDAIQAGETVGSFSRDTESSSGALFDDLDHVIKDGPSFIIASQFAVEFLNKADAQTGTDPAIIIPDSTGTPHSVIQVFPGQRSHRVDLLSFFEHAQLRRKTTNDGSLTNSEVGDDAFIQYSPLALPFNGTSWVGPQYIPPGGDPTLSRLAPYASDWVLGRSQILLRDINTIPGTDTYLSTKYGNLGNVYLVDLRPLSRFSQDSTGATGPHYSRWDIAGITLEQFRQKVITAVLQQPNLWWVPLVTSEEPTYSGTPPLINYTGGTNSPYPDFNRFQADPRIDAPLDARSVANLSPYFLQHCSQFIVEYAGDYMQQDPYGNSKGVGPDGTVDFTVDAKGNRQIRWYGMPRMTHILAPGTNPSITIANNDVVPLRDYYYAANGSVPPFEYCNFPPAADYTANGALPSNPVFIAAWHNNCPSMIRILIKLDDPNNKVQDGPWYEYVFRLK